MKEEWTEMNRTERCGLLGRRSGHSGTFLRHSGTKHGHDETVVLPEWKSLLSMERNRACWALGLSMYYFWLASSGLSPSTYQH